jgi:leader peptidase (prepilin peptidase)/N-methyltransferase
LLNDALNYTYYFLLGILALSMGSFLNVVIVRLPRMLLEPEDYKMNLALPASHCPSCQKSIHWFDNIPIFSFLALRGQCRHCQQKISFRYPLVEILTLFCSVLVAFQFGFTIKTLAALGLSCALVALSFIDWEKMLLPDVITLPILWLGLLCNVFGIFTTPTSAILGAAAGYLILWSVYWLFKLFTGKEGMGYGDFKLLAMLGAWLGWQALPFIILISSTLAASIGFALMLFKSYSKNTPIPYGPFLAIAGFIALLYGNRLMLFLSFWITP